MSERCERTSERTSEWPNTPGVDFIYFQPTVLSYQKTGEIMNISSESAFGQGGSSASSAIDGEDSIFDRGLTDFMDGSPAGTCSVL